MSLPSLADKSEFASEYSLQLVTVICLSASMENMSLHCATCPCDCTLHSGDSS